MDPLWTIAARNTLRHRRRTAVTGVVMAVGIGFFVMFDSMLAGMDRVTIDTMVSYTDSFAKIRTPAYVANLAGTPLEHGIPDPEGTARAALASDPRLTAAAPRTRFVARLSNYVDEIPVIATAVDPVRDPAVLDLPGLVREGAWLGKGAAGGSGAAGEVVMGRELAGELGLKAGDSVLVQARTVYDNVNADEYLVAGLLEGASPEINRASLYMSYADAERLLGEGLPVTEIVLASTRHPSLDRLVAASSAAAASASAALPGLRVDPVSELARDYLAMRAMKSKGSYMIILVVLLIAAVGIVNTILMSVYSRIREIGVLRAYGMTPRDIKRLFTREGIIVGVAGSLAGVLLGILLVWYLASVGVSMEALVGKVDMGGIPVAGRLFGEWKPASMAFGFLFGVTVAWISARIPAKRASRLEVTDALRFV